MRRPDLDGYGMREKILWFSRLHRRAGLAGKALNPMRFDPNLF